MIKNKEKTNIMENKTLGKKRKIDNFFSEKMGLILSIIGLVIFVITPIIFIMFRSWSFSTTIDESRIGQFGDFIGGVVGSIFAFVGVVLYYIALREQRKDLKINQDAFKLQIEALNQQVKEFEAQKDELQETRKVYEEQTTLFREQTECYKKQAQEAKNQTKLAGIQQFISSFYSLLNVLICIQNKNKDVFNNTYCYLQDNFQKESIVKDIVNVKNNYIDYFYTHSDDLSHCFKTIYRILKLIDTANIDIDIKEQYAKILRSQLSQKELLVLYYNYHTELGERVQNLAVRYDLFKHISQFDKIELSCVCSSDINRNKLQIYTKKISSIILDNVKKFTDIEQVDDICIEENLEFIGISSDFSIKIDDSKFHFSISFTNKDWEQQKIFDKDELQEIIVRFLYDIFFMSRFNIPIGDEFSKQIIEGEKQIEFIFTANNNII